jgi:antitoxin (DNA-binding transcriptional repressor) of toxin-antitoxin stability system
MTVVTMLEIRQDPVSVIRKVQAGRRMILTYRGKAVMRLEPITDTFAPESDAFYRLADLAAKGGKNLSNREMDEAIYGA